MRWKRKCQSIFEGIKKKITQKNRKKVKFEIRIFFFFLLLGWRLYVSILFVFQPSINQTFESFYMPLEHTQNHRYEKQCCNSGFYDFLFSCYYCHLIPIAWAHNLRFSLCPICDCCWFHTHCHILIKRSRCANQWKHFAVAFEAKKID